MEVKRFEATPNPLTDQIGAYLKERGFYVATPVVRAPTDETDQEYVAYYIAKGDTPAGSLAELDAVANEMAGENPFGFFVFQLSQEDQQITYPVLRRDETLFEIVGYAVEEHENAQKGILARRGLPRSRNKQEEYRNPVLQHHYIILAPNKELADYAASQLSDNIATGSPSAYIPEYTMSRREAFTLGLITKEEWPSNFFAW